MSLSNRFRGVVCALLLVTMSKSCLYSQTVDGSSSANVDVRVAESMASDAVSALLESVNMTEEQKKRYDAAVSAYNDIKKLGNVVNSLSDLLKNGVLSLPCGIEQKGKSDGYTLCVRSIESDENGDSWIKASCVIPFKEKNGNVMIAFDGKAKIEGENGLGTAGELELVAPVSREIGKTTLVFNSGTKVAFGCDGFEKVVAKMSFAITSTSIKAVDAAGKPQGRIKIDVDAEFNDFDDFSVSLDVSQRFKLEGLDDFIFLLKGATLDQSYTSTSTMVKFPNGYFDNKSESDKKQWRGLAITQAEVELPSFMAANSGEGAKSAANTQKLTLENVIIDGDGFSGNATAQNIVTLGSIDTTTWSMTVDDFSINILKNDLTGLGFSGKLNAPPLGSNSMLDYDAKFSMAENNYVIDATLPDKADFPMLSGAMTINSGSRVSVKIQDSEVYPTLVLNGELSVNAMIGNSSDSKLALPDLKFDGMKISRESPTFELGAISLTGSVKTPSVAGFQLTLDSVRSFKEDENTGLRVDAKVHVTDKFQGGAGVKLYGNPDKWKFKEVQLGKINVKFDQEAFSISGGVEFLNGDETYGKGFRGELELMLLKGKLKVDAVGVFGKKDDYRYFLTDAFLETKPASGIKVSFLNFYGVGGGLYWKMQQSHGSTNSDFGKSLSGIKYVPDDNVGIGLMARTKFGFSGNEKMMDADVGLEIQLNKNWGVNFVQFRGDATFICKELGAGVGQSITNNISKIEAASKGVAKFDKSQLETPGGDGMLRASMGMMFDIGNGVFTSDLKAYLNVGGFLRGTGPDDMMGFASTYVSSDKWYTKIGGAAESDRCGVELLNIAKAQSYFMVGNDVDPLPSPPAKVLEKLSSGQQEKLNNRASSGLSDGKGIAFGVGLSVDLDAELTPFYASLGVGLGTEFLLKQYPSGAHCKGSDDPLGINGWYAQAQAWAWVDAAIGMKVKLFGKSHKYSIINGSLVSYMYGAGPRPFYFQGCVGGKFEILNGLVKGNCSFDFEVGHECEIVGGSPFGEDVIAQLTPDDGGKDVNVFIAPQLVLNVPANTEMQLDDGGTYKVCVDEFTITNTESNTTVVTTTNVSADGMTFTYKVKSPLESRKKHKVYAKVSFKKKSGSDWISVKGDDGKDCVETRTVEFTSGDRPKYIMPEHVLYSYPADRQYNFYSKEHGDAYLLVEYDYSYLFTTEKPAGYDQKVRLKNFSGTTQAAPFRYTTSPATTDSRVQFELSVSLKDFTFKADEIYSMSVVNIPKTTVSKLDANIVAQTHKVDSTTSDVDVTTHSAEGDMEILEQTEIYSAHFRTSSYSTFNAKMSGMSYGEISTNQICGPVFMLQTNLTSGSTKESFDAFEYNTNGIEHNLISVVPDYRNNSWFVYRLYPLMYDNSDIKAVVGEYVPVVKGVVELSIASKSSSLSDYDLEKGSTGTVDGRNWLLDKSMSFVNDDFYDICTKLANYAARRSSVSESVRNLLSYDQLPNLVYGNYPIKLQYMLPGKNIKSSEYVINSKITE